MDKKILIGLVVVAIIAIGGYSFPKVGMSLGVSAESTNFTLLGTQQIKVGTGCDDSYLWNSCADSSGFSLDASGNLFASGTGLIEGVFTKGGGINATSTTDTTEVFQASDLAYNRIDLTPNTGATTYTLPATSTITSLIQTAGNSQSLLLCNATTTAAITTTFAAGTGWTLLNASSTLALQPGDCATLEMYRDSDTDITGFYNPGN